MGGKQTVLGSRVDQLWEREQGQRVRQVGGT